MQRFNVRPRTVEDQKAAFAARVFKLLFRWKNMVEARRLAKNDMERAAVARLEAELVLETNELLTT